MLRIWIDATPLLLRSAGVKTYVHQWLEHMRKFAGDGIRTFPVVGKTGKLQHERSMAGKLSTFAGLSLLHFCNIPGNPAIKWVGARADVFHASHQLRSAPTNTRVTATIYDMTCWLFPKLHSEANVRVGRRFGERVMKRADGLIAISESTRCDALKILGLNPAKIEVIYPGVPERFFSAGPDAVAAVQRKYRISRPYVLFVGTIEPRKNVHNLLDAYESLDGELRQGFDLVLAGPAGWARPESLRRLNSGIPGVRYLGYVPEDDLPGLMAGATVFVYPSLYEGFGLPVAQAMAAGVPVVTSNVSSLPEVAGDAGLLVDPQSSAEIRGAIEKLLECPGLRAELTKQGKQRSRLFTWDACAAKSLKFFERVAG